MADRSVVYRLIADVSGVLAPMAQASAATKKLGDDITKSGKTSETMRKGLDSVGRAAGGIGLVAAAGLGVMIGKAAQFESAMSNVEAATHESADAMGQLREAALKAGAETAFSATEAADAITNLAKAGVSTKDILAGGLSGALSLAAAGELEVADAAENIATALTQFSLSGTQATHVADLLAAGAGKAQGEVSDMALALDYAGVPAANLGVSIEETAGTIALLSKNGIVGEKAGTSLRGMLASLTSPSAKASETMAELGIQMFNAKGEFLGLTGVAEQLRTRMKGLTDEERANALGKIFGNEQLQAANVLYREGAKGVELWERNVNDAGFAAETARIKTDNLRGDIERLGGAIDSALIKGGEGSQGFLRGLTQGATGAVDAFNKLPDAFSGLLSGMLAITAITGGGLWFGTKMVRGIADTREALKNLGSASTIATRGLKTAAAAGAAFTAALVVVETIKAIQRATDEALPGLNTMQKRLLALSETGDMAALGSQFDDVAKSIDRIGDSQASLTDRHLNTTALSDKFGSLFGIEANSLHDATREIDAVDQALAALVSSKGADTAAQALTDFARANGLTSDQLAILRANLPAYEDALAGVELAATDAANAHVGMGKKVVIAGQAVHFTADQIKEAKKAYDEARKASEGVASGFFNISKKADKAKVSLGGWIREMEKQAKALEDFTANVVKAADNNVAQGLIDELAALGPAGALRLQQLANATDEQVGRANRAYKRGQDAILGYVNATTTVPDELDTTLVVIDDEAKRKERDLRQKFVTFPKTASTELKFDTRAADAGIRAVEARLAKLTRERTLNIRITHTEDRLGPRINRASGGAVYGPGSATSDSIPAYLSNGEYVIKAAAVAKYGTAMFDRLNAMRFAQGGQVGAGVASSGVLRLSSGDIDALANAMLNARPIHGPVHVQGDGDFERQMRLSSSLAAKGGG